MEKSFPFNAVTVDGVPDRVYSAEDFAAERAAFVSNGVCADGALAVAPAGTGGLSVTVAPGIAVIDGYTYWNTAPLTLTLGAPGGTARVDRIVLRLDLEAREMRAAVRTGEAVWTENVREMVLAEVTLAADAAVIAEADVADRRVRADYILNRLEVEAALDEYRGALADYFDGADAEALAAAAQTVRRDAGAGTVLCGDGQYRAAAGELVELARYDTPGSHLFDPAACPAKNDLYTVVIQGGGGSGPFVKLADGPIGGGAGKYLCVSGLTLRPGRSYPLFVGAGGAAVGEPRPQRGRAGGASWFLSAELYAAAGGAAGDYTTRTGYAAQTDFFAGNALGGGASLLADGGVSPTAELGRGRPGTLGSGGSRGYSTGEAYTSGVGGDGAVVIFGVRA